MSSVVFSPNVLSSNEQLKGFFEANKTTDINRTLFPLSKREIATQFTNHICDSIKILSLRFIRGLHRKLTPFESIFIDELLENRLDDSGINKSLAPFSKKDLLARAHCFQRIDTPDLYMQKAIPISSIKDPKVLKIISTNFDKSKDLDFFQNGGVCRGECLWFSVLYFETKKKFPDTLDGRIQHIRSVTNLFSRGAPRAASLIQTLKLEFEALPSCNIEERRVEYFYYKTTHRLGIRVNNLDQLAKQFRNLAPGVYKFGLNRHATIYIKLDDKKAVFFDPNIGSILIDGELGEKKMAEYIMLHYGVHMDDDILKYSILSIYQFIDRAALSELERQNLLHEISRQNFWHTLNYMSFPLRLRYSSTVDLVKNIFERVVRHAIKFGACLWKEPSRNKRWSA
jgi:hypothetical protein